jgi:hypothetical protein
MCNVIPWPINIGKVRIKKRVSRGNKQVFALAYGQGDFDLIFQTPIIVVPYSVLSSLDDKEVQFDCCNDDMVIKLEQLQESIIDRVKLVHPDIFQNKTFISGLKCREYGKTLQITARNVGDISFFDQYKERIPHSSLRSEREAHLILKMRWLWVSSAYYGIEIELLQARVQMPPKENLFVDDKFIKYDKMRKMSIPVQAIEMRMQLDGLNDTDVREWRETMNLKGSTTTAAPPQPPPLPPTLVSQHGAKMPPSFLAQINKGEFALRKVSQPAESLEETRRRQVLAKLSKIVNTDRKVPSLDDIIDARSRLKATSH